MPGIDTQPVRWQPAPPRTEPPASRAFFITAGLSALLWLLSIGWIAVTSVGLRSPDEAVNRYFIQRLATTGNLTVETGLLPVQLEVLRPRSVVVDGSTIKPGSFLGLIEVGGLIQRLSGAVGVRLLTPLIIFAGCVALFRVFRRFWGRWWSLLGVIAVAFHPAIFTYSTLPYLHNGAFLGSLMISGWCLLRLLEYPTFFRAIVAGLAFGGALFFRPIEAIWTAPLIIILLFARRLWLPAVVFVLGVVIVQLPWLIMNITTYGSMLTTAYTPSGVFNSESALSTISEPTRRLLTPPGGVWNWHWLSSAWWYLVLLTPVWSLMAVLATGAYVKRKFGSWKKVVKLSLIGVVALFPLVYYGTWDLYPTTPAQDVGVYAGYVRYWLPYYVAMAAGVVVLLRQLRQPALVLAVFTFMLGSQIIAIWNHPASGLRSRMSSDDRVQQQRLGVLLNTEDDAIIIAGQHDKQFFDLRLSVPRLPQLDADWVHLKSVARSRPLYYYAAPGDGALEGNETQLIQFGFEVRERARIGNDVLFRLQ